MAKNGNKSNANDESPRVYKAASVHKRRADSRPIDDNLSGDESSVNASSGEKALGEGGGSQAGTSDDTVALEAIAEKGTDNAIGENGEGEVSSEIDAGADVDAEADANVDAETESEEDAEKGAAKHAKPKKRRWKLVVGIIFGAIVASMLVIVGYIAGNRWVRYDDAADMQGRWYVYGTDVPLRFENNSIVLNDDTSYAYHIDSTAKTIEYTFGNLAGQGRYWFNSERNVLVITDGTDYTMWSTLLDDVSYDLGCLFGKNELPTTESSIVLSRSVVQDSSKPAASATAGENASESASSSEASGKDSADESTDTLVVSDIMMEEPKEDQDGQNGQNDQYGTYGQ